MKNAKNLSLAQKFTVALLALVFLLGVPFAFSPNTVLAEQQKEIIYFDDVEYYGTGTFVDDSYIVNYDEVEITVKGHQSAPSLGIHDNSINNACATVAGANIVTFYDRFYPELIPNFEPGAITPYGFWAYYPDTGREPTNQLVVTLHTLMNSADGTTEAEFMNGMQSFVSSKNRSISYSSFYSSRVNVNLSALATAIDQGKVGLLMCSTYNFVSALDNIAELNRVYVAKQNCSAAHMMMVYGYEIYNYYVDGELTRTETFLAVSSGYSNGAKGYILLDDYLTIEKAYIVGIS